MPRKHRRVHHPRTNCRCPEGAKKVETCKKGVDEGDKCRGRSFGCVAMVLRPGTRKPVPRFVKMICDPEAGPVQQWKSPYRKPGKGRKKRTYAERVTYALPADQRRFYPPPRDPVQLPMLLHNDPQMPLEFNRKFQPPRDPVQLPMLLHNDPQLPLRFNRKSTPPDPVLVENEMKKWWRE